MKKDFCGVPEALWLERLVKGPQQMISNPTLLGFHFSDLLLLKCGRASTSEVFVLWPRINQKFPGKYLHCYFPKGFFPACPILEVQEAHVVVLNLAVRRKEMKCFVWCHINLSGCSQRFVTRGFICFSSLATALLATVCERSFLVLSVWCEDSSRPYSL